MPDDIHFCPVSVFCAFCCRLITLWLWKWESGNLKSWRMLLLWNKINYKPDKLHYRKADICRTHALCEKWICMLNRRADVSAVDGGAFLTHLSFSLPSIKHPWGLFVYMLMCVIAFSACRCVCVRAIHSCLLTFWRSTVRLSHGIVFRLRHSSETFLAFYSLIKTAGLPWVLCVSGTLLPLPAPRWTTRTCMCVCMSLMNPSQQS